MTFTPLHGTTPLVTEFKRTAVNLIDGTNADRDEKRRCIVQAGWAHAPHLGEKDIEDMKASTPPHLLDARMNGNPTMGSGNVYPLPRSMIQMNPIPIQPFWKKLSGLDVGFRVTAAVFGAYDVDNDIIYIYDEYYGEQQNPASNAAAIRHRTGKWMPIMIDPASRQRSQVDGTKLIMEYRKEGLDVRPADNAVEAGIFAVWQRLQTGRLKIFSNCQNLLREYETYQRDLDGKIKKVDDHELDATRYLVMGLEHAKFQQTKDPYAGYEYKNPYSF